MTIRPARPEDAPAICAIWNRIIRDTLITFTTVERSQQALAADISDPGRTFLVAEQDGDVVGYASYTRFRGGPGYDFTREHSIQLADHARGKGLGRKLMQALTDIAQAEGIHVLIAGISSAAPGSIAFHAALGFTETARMPEVGRKNGQWLDLIFMQKILAAHPDTPLQPD